MLKDGASGSRRFVHHSVTVDPEGRAELKSGSGNPSAKGFMVESPPSLSPALYNMCSHS